ncbi:MAG: GntR family transcriptional regulator [Herbaspirillum sp.]|jgi:DNA-binding GntR family transcriptional regulator|nr:GntR family transcriptional regulator [Herbaspirillum sp.]
MANLKVNNKTMGAGNSRQAPQALQAYQMIEEMIVKGVLEPGAKFSEKALSDMIGLGRTPIREALQRLASEGMVTIVPRAGILIAAIDITDQFRLIEVRRELEKLLAGRAARLVSAEECEIFRTLAVRFREAGETGDAELFIPTDREFNARIAETANNKYALFAMSAIQAQTRRFWFLYFRRFGDLKKVCEFHAKMAEAIASADEISAKKASDNLIDYVDQYTRRTLDALCVA